MRTYEAMCVFRPEDETFTRGKDIVRDELTKLEAKVIREEDMGLRTLAYPIQKTHQAHFFYFVVEMEPEKAHITENALKLKTELLRFMMVKQET